MNGDKSPPPPAGDGMSPLQESPAVTALHVECASGKATRRSLAVAYAMVMGAWAADRSIDLRPVHAAMCEALCIDLRKLDLVKVQAWAIYDAMVERRNRLSFTGEMEVSDGYHR